MVGESDGIEEAFDGQLRVAITAAGRIGETLARAREDAARRAQAVSQQEARELASRLEAEKRAARVELGSVYRSDWWERATPEQIGRTLATARAWGTEDPEAVRAEGRMRDELRTRYGVDVDRAGGDPQAVQAAVDAELLRRQSETEQQRGTGDEAEAALLMREADRADRQADATNESAENAPKGSEEYTQAREETQTHERTAESARAEAGSKYDSAERRQADASKLEARGIEREAVAAKMSADVGNAKPATEAVKGTPAGTAKAKPARSAATRVQRSELGR